MPPFHNPQDCGYPRLYATAPNGTTYAFNATAVLVDDGTAVKITATVPVDFAVVASSYGRASWPMTIFFSATGVPVLPWYATLNQTLPWVIPSMAVDGNHALVGGYAPVELDRPWEQPAI
jgi:sialate O-acetylesterase